MIDSDMCSLQGENFKEIEDVIDARKRLGQYNVYKHTNPLNIRCIYSSIRNPQPAVVNRTVKFDEASVVSTEKESFFGCSVKRTDSEITIVKVKCTGDRFKKKLNQWDMNDIAIPGDGTHLGESPSMVNLVTLVPQNVQCEGDDEYLVPLSSWDPFIKNEEVKTTIKCCSSEAKINKKCTLPSSYTDPNISYRLENSESTISEGELDETFSPARRSSWAGKFSKFVRKHWQKTKVPSESETAEDGDDENRSKNDNDDK